MTQTKPEKIQQLATGVLTAVPVRVLLCTGTREDLGFEWWNITGDIEDNPL
jgi:hypothetical protein